jgi:hypothetical protein
MLDPKMALTKFTDVYAARQSPDALEASRGPSGARRRGARRGRPGAFLRAGGAPEFGELTAELAAAGSVREGDEAALLNAQAQYSISSYEELIALAGVDRRMKSSLVRRTGVPVATVRQVARTFRATAHGKEELSDWRRYERLSYSTGCDIDLNKPPADHPDGLAADIGARAPAGGAGGIALAAPSGGADVTLIDHYMGSIRDQQNRGTCTAFSGIACLEYHEHRFGGRLGANLSEQFAYWEMVSATGQHALGPMFGGLLNAGACSEATWPYYGTEIAGDDAQGPPPPRAVERALGHRPASVLHVPPRSAAKIRRVIQGFHCVAVGIPVYASWYESPVVRKYGNITVPLPGEVPEDIGHAIALVGFADDPQYAGGGYFIVRNSWGKNWGTQSVFGPGYGTIPYRYVTRFNWDAWYVAQ